MTSELLQIKQSYEQLHMTPEQIAQDRDMEVEAVKAGLMQCSATFRKACGQTEGGAEICSDEELERINEGIKNIAFYAEDEHLRFKALTYCRDDKKGRKEVVKQMGHQTFNILQFNEGLRAMKDKAREAKDRILGSNTIPV